jgi:hypothetical protein
MSLYVLAFLIGVIAGLRSLTAPAVLSWAARLGWLHLENTGLAFLACARNTCCACWRSRSWLRTRYSEPQGAGEFCRSAGHRGTVWRGFRQPPAVADRGGYWRA